MRSWMAAARSPRRMWIGASVQFAPPQRSSVKTLVSYAVGRRTIWQSTRDTVGPLTLERLAEAARQERRLGLPVLVSGGRPDERSDDSLAGMMSVALQNNFGIPARWREDRSRNTFENAAFSAEILRRAGVPSALLVTQSWDMARAGKR